MPQAPLIDEQKVMASSMMSSFMAAFKQFRPDLDYPESASDMQAGFRGVLRMFNVSRASLPNQLWTPCPDCDGTGKHTVDNDPHHKNSCKRCMNSGRQGSLRI